MNLEEYRTQRRNRSLNKYRIRLGVSQMIAYPYLNLLLIPIIVISIYIWIIKDKLVYNLNLPEMLMILYYYLITIIAIIMPILLLLLLVERIAKYTARKPEADIQEAFSKQEMINGNPILIEKKKIKGTEITRYVFYSSIPLKVWIDKKDFIASSMNINFVEEIKYYKSNGRKIVMDTSKGMNALKRGDLYDDEF